MSFTANDLPDLSGITAVVTGANSGIGYVTALELARHGADVTLACRNTVKAAQAVARIEAAVPGAKVSADPLDLASLDSVRTFAAAWTGPLDLLVNNGGVMAPMRRAITADGFELQMGTNYLGPFALTGLLLPHLLAAPAPRVVSVASIAHRGARLNLDDLQSAAGYNPQTSYSNTKLADLLFALELQRRATAAGSTLVSTAAHPGLASTALVTNPDGMGGNWLLRVFAPPVVKIIAQSAAAGARPLLYAAVEAAPGSYSGPQSLRESRGAVGPAKLSAAAQDVTLAADLWDLSGQLTGVDYDWTVPRG